VPAPRSRQHRCCGRSWCAWASLLPWVSSFGSPPGLLALVVTQRSIPNSFPNAAYLQWPSPAFHSASRAAPRCHILQALCHAQSAPHTLRQPTSLLPQDDSQGHPGSPSTPPHCPLAAALWTEGSLGAGPCRPQYTDVGRGVVQHSLGFQQSQFGLMLGEAQGARCRVVPCL